MPWPKRSTRFCAASMTISERQMLRSHVAAPRQASGDERRPQRRGGLARRVFADRAAAAVHRRRVVDRIHVRRHDIRHGHGFDGVFVECGRDRSCCRTRAGLIISPICPHALSNRSVIAGENSVARCQVASAAGELLLTVDGQVQLRMRVGDEVEVRRSPAHGATGDAEGTFVLWNSERETEVERSQCLRVQKLLRRRLRRC